MKTNIEMAQECGLIGMRPHLDGIYQQALVQFAELVRADERAALALKARRNSNSTFALQLRARGNT